MRLAATILAALLAAAPAAHADSDTHYADHVVGERAAGMGGAFTALADEAAGAYYNPAGIIAARSVLTQLSMSAYKWRRRSAVMGDVCGTQFRADESTFFGFPGSFGFVKQLRSGSVAHALGLTLVVPHSEKSTISFVDRSARCERYAVGIGGSAFRVDRVFWSALSYAIRPWRFLQAGLSVGVAIRTGTMTSFVAAVPDDGTATAYLPALDFFDGEATIASLFLQAGVIVMPSERLRLGVAVTTPHFRLVGSGRATLMAAVSDPASWQLTSSGSRDDVSYRWQVPLAVALGAAWVARRFTIAADVRIHAPAERYAVLEHPDVGTLVSNERAAVVNASLGGELHLHPRVALRLGVFSNLSSLPEAEIVQGRDRIHLLGLATGASVRTSAASALSFALQAQLGSGSGRAPRLRYEGGVLRSENVLVDSSQQSLVVSVGGSFDVR
jgi:long-chain fatty acid transport protein